jgi:hypothetical protein
MQKKMYVARPEEKDMVNHPSHYNVGDYECLTVMESLYGIEAVINFCMLNAFKYQWRCNRKNNCKEDLQKARWYNKKALELMDKLNKNE